MQGSSHMEKNVIGHHTDIEFYLAGSDEIVGND